MCGILSKFSTVPSPRSSFVAANNELRHRGPDASGIWSSENECIHIGHNRLSIVSVNTGGQPIIKDNIVLCVNGEIYNYLDLAASIGFDAANISDCESIIHVYKRYGATKEALQQLDGMFAFVLFDTSKNLAWSARDPYGVTSLYIAEDSEGSVMIASEMKAILRLSSRIITLKEFQPGSMEVMRGDGSERSQEIYHPAFLDESLWKGVPESNMSYEEAVVVVRESFEAAVVKREMADVPSGVLLSGGLDSSIVAAVMSRRTLGNHTTPQNETLMLEDSRLQSFSIGLKGSPDHAAARVVAKAIGTHHHELHFTVQKALDAIPDVIRHLETYDVTTIRASTPMFLLSRAIKARGIKMVLSGEGSDEIFGGYLYFHSAPDEVSFKKECEQRVRDLHYFDCLRANKSTMAWGLEVRVPFLDKEFVDRSMRIPTSYKMCGGGKLEKQILRDAFKGYLPEEILMRQKEQFSDGVGYQWIDELKIYTAAQVSDAEFAEREQRYGYNTPTTKEAFLYRKTFESMFDQVASKTVHAWVPKREWGCNEDPSGRAQKEHTMAL